MRKPHKKIKQAALGQVRVIGGEWRGRKLPVVEAEGLRPTPDRVRETLFNWLQFSIPGKTCLDAFAGSGALAVEALSRGAKQVTAIERDIKVTKQLGGLLLPLAGERLTLVNADALNWLEQQPAQPFEIIFLDPPYGLPLLEPVCHLLEAKGWLAEGALIYVEQAKHQAGLIHLPANWRLQKDKQVSDVHFSLYTR
ncbi:16S rRNA (guanine(966)-N(2))-methyltransferase RsmD [Marinospirillum insulare]|uniref:Ribosomal RNA small subunit methyltransferase D n=1 Tax=Marinospirillum insulare TaxID=217169 RepID=A0ABQ5ZYC8_9GAMM|nr:16S rRNA (guanine(966)-N(2))-methyltransferase RsmD [Marinospirillum insulare]GLR65200.1 ribosomal RNA small subunit methyltransferase D [Marinospirillum insulare]